MKQRADRSQRQIECYCKAFNKRGRCAKNVSYNAPERSQCGRQASDRRCRAVCDASKQFREREQKNLAQPRRRPRGVVKRIVECLEAANVALVHNAAEPLDASTHGVNALECRQHVVAALAENLHGKSGASRRVANGVELGGCVLKDRTRVALLQLLLRDAERGERQRLLLGTGPRRADRFQSFGLGGRESLCLDASHVGGD